MNEAGNRGSERMTRVVIAAFVRHRFPWDASGLRFGMIRSAMSSAPKQPKIEIHLEIFPHQQHEFAHGLPPAVTDNDNEYCQYSSANE